MNVGITLLSFLDIYPEVELLYYMELLISLGTAILFSVVAVPLYIANNSAQGFQFLHSFTTVVIFSFVLYYSHPHEYEIVAHSWFDLHFCSDS